MRVGLFLRPLGKRLDKQASAEKSAGALASPISWISRFNSVLRNHHSTSKGEPENGEDICLPQRCRLQGLW